ncbi:MAG: hypothetical protein OXG02_05590 [Chloroflexi bacterium]|nr:hypothetical protein [Chloroflexota bacterium]
MVGEGQHARQRIEDIAMGDCKFCGKPAGFLRNEHKECKRRHERGKAEFIQQIAAAPDRGDLAPLPDRLREIAATCQIERTMLPALMIAGFEEAVERFLDDHLLTVQEEEKLSELMKVLPVSQEELNRNGAVTRLTQCATLRDIQEGIVPQRIQFDGMLPFNLQKSESLVWVFQNVAYLEQRTRTEFVGGSQGMSFRVAKGVYYRKGGFKGRRVERTETAHADTGWLGVTTKHVYFAGAAKRFRIRFDKIVTFEPYDDGIGLMRDAQTAKPQTFVTGDGWFTYNLIANLAQM